MNLEPLRQAVLNSSSSGTPATAYPELQKYYDINFQLPLSNAGATALARSAGVQNEQADFDRRQQISRLQDKIEGRGYARRPRDDGGFGFFDPDGNAISAHQYARATGKSVVDVLSDSENPIDRQFALDYQNLQDFLDAAVSGDRETLNAFYAENPSLRDQPPAEVLKQFKAAYPTVYGLNRPGQRLGSTFIPSLASLQAGAGWSDFEE